MWYFDCVNILRIHVDTFCHYLPSWTSSLSWVSEQTMPIICVCEKLYLVIIVKTELFSFSSNALAIRLQGESKYGKDVQLSLQVSITSGADAGIGGVMSTDAWQLLLTHNLGREEIISNLYQFGKSLLQTHHHRPSLLTNVPHKVGRSVPPSRF